MYIIVVGVGSIGSSLIDIAVKERNNVVVIDANPDRAKEVGAKYDVTVLKGNATSLETLQEAGADRANALIATTSDDAINLMIISIAAELKIPSIVSVVNDKEHTEFFRKLGANVMENPDEVVANHLYNSLKHHKVKDFTILSGGEQIFRIAVRDGSSLVGLSLADCSRREILPASLLVVALKREGQIQIPTGETVIELGDTLTIFSLERVSDELIEKLTG